MFNSEVGVGVTPIVGVIVGVESVTVEVGDRVATSFTMGVSIVGEGVLVAVGVLTLAGGNSNSETTRVGLGSFEITFSGSFLTSLFSVLFSELKSDL